VSTAFFLTRSQQTRRSPLAVVVAACSRPLEQRQVLCAFAIIVLNLIDATGTLANVSRGAIELNPLMAALLDAGDGRFVLVKHAIASFGVAGILVHPEVRAARIAMKVLLPIYTGIAIYQVVLYWLM